MNDRIENLWGSFDLLSVELVKAKRALREGRGGEGNVAWLRGELLAIGVRRNGRKGREGGRGAADDADGLAAAITKMNEANLKFNDEAVAIPRATVEAVLKWGDPTEAKFKFL